MRSHPISMQDREDTQMLSEIDCQTIAQARQATLLAEAAEHRLMRAAERRTEASAPSGRRLPAIIRRVVGAPTFA